MPNPALIPKREEFYVQVGCMFDNPYGVPREEIIAFILNNPPEVVAQVVFGRYVELSGLVFSGELIQNMIDRKYQRVMGDTYVDGGAKNESRVFNETYGYAYRRNRYFTGVDVARQTDYTVLFTIDTAVRPARVVYYRRLNRVPWETIYTEIGKARKAWGPDILMDSTGMGGDVVMDALESRSFCPIHDRTVMTGQLCRDRDGNSMGCNVRQHLPLGCVEGFNFSGTTKKQLIEHLRNVLAHGYQMLDPEAPFGLLRVPPIVQLEEEMSFYAWDDKGLSTDCIMALGLAAWAGLEDVVGDVSIGSPWGS
jgi:hypothetical protein